MPGATRLALEGSSRVAAVGASLVGEIDPEERAEVTVVLRRRAPLAPLESYALRSDRGSSRMSRREFGERHGAARKDLERLRSFAREYELTVSARAPGSRAVGLAGTLGSLQRAFGTVLQRWRSPRGEYRGRVGALSAPEPLHGALTAVLGLDTRPVAVPHYRHAAATPPGAGMTPLQVAGLYGFPANLDGTGVTVGLIELGGGFNPTDLTAYFSGLGLPVPSVQAVSVDGGTNAPGVDPNSDGEVMLDIEVAGAVAPGAKIVVYFAPNTDQGFLDAVSTAVHDTANEPGIVSISWGGPEETWTTQAANAMLDAVADAAAVGVSVTAAAGDGGATDGEPDGQLHVDLPACLPPVQACGGTRLLGRGGSIVSEVVWNDLATGDGATGGGVSKLFARPAYQASAGVPAQPETGFVGRGVPDVAGNADPETGYLVRVDGQMQVIGGTSAVAPLWAGLIARLNQGLGRSVGYLLPTLYSSAASALRDITQGNNGYYAAGPGWDACTGLGTPNGVALLRALGAGGP
jgi:kumamolisin